jgi:hypothetical protein
LHIEIKKSYMIVLLAGIHVQAMAYSSSFLEREHNLRDKAPRTAGVAGLHEVEGEIQSPFQGAKVGHQADRL